MHKPYWLVVLCACCTEGRAADPASRPLPEKFLSWPFSPGENWRITNSYAGREGHGNNIPYALDFQRAGPSRDAARQLTQQSAVRAAAPGTVIHAGPVRGYGNTVVVRHRDGFVTLYGHLKEVSVRPGAEIPALEKLGIAGNTGKSTGAHLHFEVRDIRGRQRWQDGKFVKPEPILGHKDFAGATPQRPLPRTPDGKAGSYSYTLNDLDPSVQNVATDVAEQLNKLFGTNQPRPAPRSDVGSRTPHPAGSARDPVRGTAEMLGPFRFVIPEGWAVADRQSLDGRPFLQFGKGGASDHRLFITFMEHPGMGPAVPYTPEAILDTIKAGIVRNHAANGGRLGVVSFRPGVVKGGMTVGKDRIPAVWATEAGGRILLFAHGGKVYICSAFGAGARPMADQLLGTLEISGRR